MGGSDCMQILEAVAHHRTSTQGGDMLPEHLDALRRESEATLSELGV